MKLNLRLDLSIKAASCYILGDRFQGKNKTKQQQKTSFSDLQNRLFTNFSLPQGTT